MKPISEEIDYFKVLSSTHEEWLMNRILEHAEENDFIRYTSTLKEAWRKYYHQCYQDLLRKDIFFSEREDKKYTQYYRYVKPIPKKELKKQLEAIAKMMLIEKELNRVHVFLVHVFLKS